VSAPDPTFDAIPRPVTPRPEKGQYPSQGQLHDQAGQVVHCRGPMAATTTHSARPGWPSSNPGQSGRTHAESHPERLRQQALAQQGGHAAAPRAKIRGPGLINREGNSGRSNRRPAQNNPGRHLQQQPAIVAWRPG